MISDGGRHGKVETPDGSFAVAFGSQTDSRVTPEHLFAGAYAACFHSALQAVAERAHVDMRGMTVISNVALEEDQNGSSALAVELRVAMPGLNRRDGEHLLHLAHESCAYSRASRGHIRVDVRLD